LIMVIMAIGKREKAFTLIKLVKE